MGILPMSVRGAMAFQAMHHGQDAHGTSQAKAGSSACNHAGRGEGPGLACFRRDLRTDYVMGYSRPDTGGPNDLTAT